MVLLPFSRASGTFLKSHLLFRLHLYVFSLVSRYQIAPDTLRTLVLVKSLLYLYYFVLVLLLKRAKLKTSVVLFLKLSVEQRRVGSSALKAT